MQTITIHVKMDERTLRRFAFFNDILLRKRFIRPMVFAALMCAFAVVCFVSGKPQSGLLGGVLTAIGLGLPAVYFGTFFSQLHARARKLKLDVPRAVYSLTLRPEGVHIVNDQKAEDDVDVPWDRLFAAYRRKGIIYLYATPARAFLLPDGQADATPQQVWDMLTARMPQGRCFDALKTTR